MPEIRRSATIIKKLWVNERIEGTVIPKGIPEESSDSRKKAKFLASTRRNDSY
jgi:hypothetical protein